MSSFLTDLMNSIFTPGPTPTLLVATNVSFAALQGLLLVLLIATYSVHFLILSFLCGGLWWSINWFVSELRAATEKEEEAKRLRGLRKSKESSSSLVLPTTTSETAPGGANSGDDTETEVETTARSQSAQPIGGNQRLGSGGEGEEGSVLRKRSSDDRSGEISTDSEWEKVDEEGDKEK